MYKDITVITPTYNRAKTLPRLYESLCNQTFKNFVWLIMDDGSSDNTKELVESWKEEGKVEIEYHWHENTHKVITMFRAFDLVKTDYHFRVDSDDELPAESLEILFNEMMKIKDNPSFCAVIGRIRDQNGNINGTDFPEKPLDTTAFLMKNHYNVKGVHAGLQKTSAVRSLGLNMEMYRGKGYLPDFWNYVLDVNFKTRFINDVVYIYHFMPADGASNTNARKMRKHIFGMRLSHLFFVKSYYGLYFKKYPVPVLKQLFKYLSYGLLSEDESLKEVINKLDKPLLQLIAVIMLPAVYVYNKF